MNAAITTTHPSSERPLAALSRDAIALAQASIADHTRKTYQCALDKLYTWLAGRPLNDSTLAEYCSHEYHQGKSPATIALTVAAVKFTCKINARQSPTGPATQWVLSGIRRQGANRGRGQAKAVNWVQADSMAVISENGGDSLAELRDAALVSILSDGLLRVSEVIALEVSDIEAEGDNTITVRRSKTD